jgi:ribonuclease P protein component
VTPPSHPCRFGADRRLHARREFTRAYEQGRKLHGRYLTVFVFRTDRPVARLGVTVTRKFGDAVTRNRAKRQLREIFRTSALPPGLDIVIVPKREYADASYADLAADLRAVLSRRERGRVPPGGSNRPAEPARDPRRPSGV